MLAGFVTVARGEGRVWVQLWRGLGLLWLGAVVFLCRMRMGSWQWRCLWRFGVVGEV